MPGGSSRFCLLLPLQSRTVTTLRHLPTYRLPKLGRFPARPAVLRVRIRGQVDRLYLPYLPLRVIAAHLRVQMGSVGGMRRSDR